MDQKICVYLADVKPLKDTNNFNKLYDKVSDLRKKKTDEKMCVKDKILSLGSEYLLMMACKDFGIEYEKEKILVDSFSKPYFINNNIYFNISHSKEKVMCIMSYKPVGCDIEKIRSINPDIAKRHFTNSEYQIIENSDDRDGEFFKYWTLKESYTKCVGLGLSLPMNSFEIKIEDNDIKVINNDNKGYYLFKNVKQDGYSYSWCVNGEVLIENIPVYIKTIEI